MAGEDSNSSGVLGEDYIKDFLKLIGWTPYSSGIKVECSASERHKKPKNKTRQSHGIDDLYSYKSPMDLGVLTHAIISVKHRKSYINSEFSEFFKELAYTIECFKKSDEIINSRENINKGFDSEEIIGVLFWMSTEEKNDYSLIPKLTNPASINELSFRRIQIMDNDRVEFLTNCIEYIQSRFSKHKFSFYYIDTPYNFDDKDKKYDGDILPIEMLSSDVQVFKLQKDEEIILAIILKDIFNQDSLKRILGLAHRISSNLVSTIQIFFPSFHHQTQENINIVENIKNGFEGKNFIKNIHIYGYGTGFKKIKDEVIISEVKKNENFIEHKIDTGRFLPYGEFLRSLLIQPTIKDYNLKKLLVQKGIYTSSQKKEYSIPILTSLILSPKEYSILREYQKTEEDREKRYSSRFKTIKKINLKELKNALTAIDLNRIDDEDIKNYKYKIPIINFKMNKEKNYLEIDYEIERCLKNKSWDEQINHFKASVILNIQEDCFEIIAKNISTSTETLKINQKIISDIKQTLIKQDILSSKVQEEKVLMCDMTNKEILQFLLAFTNNDILENLKFIDILSIDIEIDDKVTLPEDSQIKWMEDKIKKIKLDGKKIEDIEILTDDKNHEYLKCWGIIVSYEHKDELMWGKGTATLELKFNISNKNEFFIQIGKCKFDKKKYTEKNVREMILLDIDNIKNKKHKEIMEKKNVKHT